MLTLTLLSINVTPMLYDLKSLEIFLNAKELFCVIYYTSERKVYNKYGFLLLNSLNN